MWERRALRSSAKRLRLRGRGAHTWFLQSTQRHMSEHSTLLWKHSQYFFRQPDFLQLHPRACLGSETLILGLKACGFRSKVALMASLRTPSASIVLRQLAQLQPLQYWLAAKQSQYSFKHLDFMQLQQTGLVLGTTAGSLAFLTALVGLGGGGGDAGAVSTASSGASVICTGTTLALKERVEPPRAEKSSF